MDEASTPASDTQPGRPRSETARRAILEAAFALLVERGFERLSIEQVAERAGTGRATIYRWWASKGELVLDAFLDATRAELTLPETESARGDFYVQIRGLAALLADARGQALAGMLGGARSDPELARLLGERWLTPRRRWGFARIMRAQAAGQLRPGVEPGAALALLYGPLYAPLLFGEPVPGPQDVERLLAITLPAIFGD